MKSFIVRVQMAPRQTEAMLRATRDGRTYTQEIPEDIEVERKARIKWMRGLKASGKVLCAGPVTDFTWGLMIFKVDSLEELEEILKEDPFIRKGLITDYEVTEWYHVV